MATYYTDFQDQTVGEAPEGWTLRYRTPNVFDVQETGGQKYLQITRGPNNTTMHGASWDTVGTPTNVELFGVVEARSQPQSFIRLLVLFCRASGTVDNETLYGTSLYTHNDDVSSYRLQRYVGGTNVQPSAGQHIFDWSHNTIYCFRFRVNGTNVRMKVWEPASPFTNPTGDEPSSWDVDATDTNITSGGWVGFGTITDSPTNGSRLYAFGVGTDGDTAPSDGGDPPTLSVPTGFTFTAAPAARQLNGGWDAVGEADSYDWQVEENDGGTWVPFDDGNTSGTSFQLDDGDGVEFGTTYRARVRAVQD